MTSTTHHHRRDGGTIRQQGWWWPAVQGWVIGVVFVAAYLATFHAPTPHHARVDVAPGAAGAAVRRLAEANHPGWWVFTPVPSAAAAARDVRREIAFAAVVPGPAATVLLAGANGPSARAAVLSALPSAESSAGLHPTVVDVLPLRPGDASGLSLFYLSFGSVLAGYLFAIASVTLGAGLSPRAHQTSSVALAVALGASVAVLAGPVFGVVAVADAPAVGAVVALLVTCVAATTAFLLTTFRSLGTVIGTVFLLTLGTASGGVLPAPMLPGWAQALRSVLPNGLALDALRSITYFHGAPTAGRVIGLALWAVVPLAALSARLRRRTPVPTAE